MKKVENIEKNQLKNNKKLSLVGLSLLMSGVMATSFSACDNSKKAIKANDTTYEHAIKYEDWDLLSYTNVIENDTDNSKEIGLRVPKIKYTSVLPTEEYENYAGYEYKAYDTYDEISIDPIKHNEGQFLGSRPMKNTKDEVMFFMNIPKFYDLDKIKEDYPETDGYTLVDNGEYYQVRRMNQVTYSAPQGFVRKGDKAILTANMKAEKYYENETATILYDPNITEEDYQLYDGYDYVHMGDVDDLDPNYIILSATRRVVYTAPTGFTLGADGAEMIISNTTNGITDELREKYPESEGYTITEDGANIIIKHPAIENISYIIPKGFSLYIKDEGLDCGVYGCKYVGKNYNASKLTKGL